MTMWYAAGDPLTFMVQYELDGQYVLPTSASYKLRDSLGAQIAMGALSVASTSAPLAIAQGFNVLTSPNLFENRFVEVTFIHLGSSYQQQFSYTIRGFCPTTATAAQVRAELGLDFSELGDSDIDVYAAFYRLPSSLTAAFTTPGTKALAANKAVVVQAALDVASSLEMRAAVQTRSEDHQFARSATLDFQAIRSRLRGQLAQLIDEALGTVAVTSSIFALSNPTDVVTGA